MPHWRSMTDRGDWLFAYDLKGRDVVLTIAEVTPGEVVGDKGKRTKRPVVAFKGTPKKLALNATNAKTIAALYGNDTERWAGQRVALYPTTTEMGGETVECIRIRPRVPPSKGDKADAQQAEQQPEGADSGGS